MQKDDVHIVVLDGYTAAHGELGWDALERLGHLTVYDRTTPADTIGRCREADVVLTNKVCLRREELSRLPRLRYIGVLATGYNVVDVEAARERGIVVTNVPAYSTDSVAQMVMAHLLTVTNRVEHYADKNRQGEWAHCPDFCYWDTPLTELCGKTMGIVGLGNIGRRVAAISQALGMNVLALTSKSNAQLPEGIGKVSLQELFRLSDVVSLHCPLTPQTHHLVCAETLSMMKPSAILINTGRGPLVDEQAVADALRAHRIAAYCADVLATEPPQDDSPLLRCADAFITPHIAWATKEARQRLIAVAIDNVAKFLGGVSQNRV